MNSNTFLLSFGIDPSNFVDVPNEPIKEDDGFTFYVEEKKDKVPCKYCSSTNVYSKGSYLRTINVTDNSQIKKQIIVKKQRFYCRDCKRSFTLPIKGVEQGFRLSNFNKIQLYNEYKEALTYSQIAKKFNISTARAINLFDELHPTVKRLKMPRILCIDEIYFCKKRNHKYICVISNFETGEIVDILESRLLSYLNDYFANIPEKELKQVEYFISDMYDAYRTIKNRFMPKAKHVIDKFHITLQLTNAINSLRIRAMNNCDEDSMERSFMKSKYELFLCKQSDIPDSFYHQKRTGRVEHFTDMVFDCIKKDQDFWDGYAILQELLTYGRYRSFEDALKFIRRISNKLLTSNSDKLKQVGKTYTKWEIGIAEAHTYNMYNYNLSNALSEGNNNALSTLLKIFYGSRSYDRFRRRALLIFRENKGKKKK